MGCPSFKYMEFKKYSKNPLPALNLFIGINPFPAYGFLFLNLLQRLKNALRDKFTPPLHEFFINYLIS